MAAQRWFAKLLLNKPKYPWTDETKVEPFGHNAQLDIWWKPNVAYEQKRSILTVKHDGGEVVTRVCFAVTGFGHPAVMECTMNSSVNQSVLELNVSLSEQDNDPKRSNKSTTE